MLRPTAPTARRTFPNLGKTIRENAPRRDGLTTVGLRPPFASPSRRLSHPDCRSVLTLIVALQLNAARGPYRSKDGYIALLPYTDANWRELCSLIARPDAQGAKEFQPPRRG